MFSALIWLFVVSAAASSICQESDYSIETMDEELLREAAALSMAIPLMETVTTSHGEEDEIVDSALQGHQITHLPDHDNSMPPEVQPAALNGTNDVENSAFQNNKQFDGLRGTISAVEKSACKAVDFDPEAVLREILNENWTLKHAVQKSTRRLFVLRGELNAYKKSDAQYKDMLERMYQKASSLQRDYNALSQELTTCQQNLAQKEEEAKELQTANRALKEEQRQVETRNALQLQEQGRELQAVLEKADLDAKSSAQEIIFLKARLEEMNAASRRGASEEAASVAQLEEKVEELNWKLVEQINKCSEKYDRVRDLQVVVVKQHMLFEEMKFQMEGKDRWIAALLDAETCLKRVNENLTIEVEDLRSKILCAEQWQRP